MVTTDPEDPNTWTRSQQIVLRWIAGEGGWATEWPDSPSPAARRAVEKRLGITFQREHPLHECPWYEPADSADHRLLLRLAAMLPDEDGNWKR